MFIPYNFSSSVNYHHSSKHDSIKADMLLGKLRFLHIDSQPVRRRMSSAGSQEESLFYTGRSLSLGTSKANTTMIHFLQHGHIYSKKTTPHLVIVSFLNPSFFKPSPYVCVLCVCLMLAYDIYHLVYNLWYVTFMQGIQSYSTNWAPSVHYHAFNFMKRSSKYSNIVF